ncbi:50S ribosomal protein L28 [archaeon]|nr:MAG: 50S ribosomal protein L28 [archaeon]
MRERKCDLTGRRKNSKAMTISKSNIHTHREQGVNLHWQKLWWEEGNKFVRLRLAARTIKTIKLKGLQAVAMKHGVNLNKFAISSGSALKKVAEVVTV